VLPEKFYVPAQGVGETDVVYRENLRRHGGEVVPVLAGLVAGDTDDTKDLSCRLTVDGCRDDHVHVESAFVEIEHAHAQCLVERLAAAGALGTLADANPVNAWVLALLESHHDVDIAPLEPYQALLVDVAQIAQE